MMCKLTKIAIYISLLPIALLFFVACSIDNSVGYRNIVSVLGGVWEFDSPTDYTYVENQIEILDGKAQLKLVDQTHSDDDFNQGRQIGTRLSESGNLTLSNRLSKSTIDVKEILPLKASALLAYWKFDGDFTDSSGNQINLIPSSNLEATGESFAEGNALQLDGVDQRAELPSTLEIPLNSKITISFWNFVRSADTKAANAISIGEYSATNRINVHAPYSNNDIYWDFGDTLGAGRISTSYANYLDKWTHVTLVSEGRGGVFKGIYLDGILVASNGTSDGPSTVKIGGSVGSDTPGVANFHKGSLDEFAIWTDALSATEIQSLYEAQAGNYTELSSAWTPKYQNIVGYWKMDGNWQDSSSNENHGTANGDASFNIEAKVGSHAGNFDGTGDYADFGQPSDFNFGTNPFSVMGWFKTSSDTNTWRYIFGNAVHASSGFHVALVRNGIADGNKLNFGVKGGGGDLGAANSNSEVNDGSWHHFAITRDGTDISMYIDGIVQEQSTIPAGSSINAAQNNTIGTSFPGDIDDVALWGVAVTASEVQTIYSRQKQKYAGHYESPVIDLGASGSWTNLDTITSLPFGKEIVPQANESSSDYPSSDSDLRNGLIGYWNFDEQILNSYAAGGDFLDKVLSTTLLNESGGVSLKRSSYLNRGLSLDGVDDTLASNDSSMLPYGSSSRTISLWVKPNSLQAKSLIGYGTPGGSQAFAITSTAAGKIGAHWFGNSVNIEFPNSNYYVGKWQFITVTYDGSSARVYIDGALTDSFSVALNTIDSGEFNVGSGIHGPLDFYGGEIDEVAIWSRSLTPSEIQQLYRRGANRIKYQVKSCVDSSCECKSFNTTPVGSANDCDGDSIPNATDFDDIYKAEFTGPGGNGITAFSELYNRDASDMTFTCNANTTDSDNDICVNDEITLAGDSNTSSPSFDFSLFPNSAQPANNRYFQYRVMMEAEDNTACSGKPCLPELMSVEIGPTGRYYSGSPSVVNKMSHTIDKALDNLQVTNSSGCNMSYQISNDGTNFYYWDGLAWTSGSHVSQSNDLVTLNNMLSKFTEQIGLGEFHFKSYLGNSNFGECELDKVQVIKARK